MVNAQVVFRKNQKDGFKDKMLVAKDATRRESKVLKIQRKPQVRL